MNNLKAQWKISFTILCSPIVLTTLLFTAGTLLLVTAFSSNAAIVIIFSILSAISGGVLGGIMWEKYREISGNSELLKKGKSAVRNLVLIDDQLNRLRNSLIINDRNNKPLTVDDIDHHLLTAEKNIISAIEDWVDMMPDLRKLAELAQSLSQQSERFKEILDEKASLEKELHKKGANEKELSKQIKQKDSELGNVYSEISRLKRQQLTISSPTITDSSIFGPTSSPLSNALLSQRCDVCGESYIYNINTPVTNRCAQHQNTIII